jgi:hypothetical protein
VEFELLKAPATACITVRGCFHTAHTTILIIEHLHSSCGNMAIAITMQGDGKKLRIGSAAARILYLQVWVPSAAQSVFGRLP